MFNAINVITELKLNDKYVLHCVGFVTFVIDCGWVDHWLMIIIIINITCLSSILILVVFWLQY